MHRSLPRFLQKHLQRCRFGLGQFRFFASAFFFAAVAPQKSSTCSHTLQPDSQTRREAPRTAVVVRICQPTAAALRRIAEWARQCTESQRSARIDFFMSIDATRTDRCKLRGAIRTALEAEGLALEHVPLHWYTESDLESAFPVMTEIRIALPQGSQNIPSRDPKSLAWGLHCECINLWRASISDSYDFFWVFEDDVGVSGNFRELIVSYLDDDSDLITGSSIDIAKPCWPPNFTLSASKERGWNWYYTATSEYRRRASEIYVAQEFVQRFSKDLLEELKNWSESDASAWSEQMSPTVCKVAGMRCRSLRPEQIGHTFTWNGRVSKEDWMAICEEVKAGKQECKLFHALKF